MEQPTFKEMLNYYGENNHSPPLGDSDFPCRGHLKKLFNCKTLRVVPVQHVIYSQGEPSHTVCFICRHGLVKLTHMESDGKPLIVGLRRAGWLLGASEVLPGLPYASTAETVTRSKLCFIPTEKFKQTMKTDALFSEWVSMILAREVYSSILRIAEQSCLSGRQRLQKFFWEMICAPDGCDPEKAVKIPIVLKRWEVAQFLGLTPQHLCRLIKQMETEGVILRKKGWLILHNPKKLWHSETA